MTAVALTEDGNPLWHKYPAAVKDYTLNYTDYLGGDTIVTSTWILPTGITNDLGTNTTTTTTIWLSGGIPERSYNIVNVIVTAGGRTEVQPIRIVIRK